MFNNRMNKPNPQKEVTVNTSVGKVPDVTVDVSDGGKCYKNKQGQWVVEKIFTNPLTKNTEKIIIIANEDCSVSRWYHVYVGE